MQKKYASNAIHRNFYLGSTQFGYQNSIREELFWNKRGLIDEIDEGTRIYVNYLKVRLGENKYGNAVNHLSSTSLTSISLFPLVL